MVCQRSSLGSLSFQSRTINAMAAPVPAAFPSILHTRSTISRRAEHLKLRYIVDYCTNLCDHGVCAVCYHQESPHTYTRHTSFDCPLGLTTAGTPYDVVFKPNLVLPPGYGCYFCGFPSTAPVFHPLHEPHVPANPHHCPWPDMAKPIAYLAWHDPALRQRVFAHLHVNHQSIEAYAHWLTQFAPQSLTLLNLHLVVFEVIACK
jgi:hypothetical protein